MLTTRSFTFSGLRDPVQVKTFISNFRHLCSPFDTSIHPMIFALLLRGKARRWWIRINSTLSDNTSQSPTDSTSSSDSTSLVHWTLERIEKVFLEKFMPKYSPDEALKRLYHLRQRNESRHALKRYLRKFKELVIAAELVDNEDLMFHFLRGLCHSYRCAVMDMLQCGNSRRGSGRSERGSGGRNNRDINVAIEIALDASLFIPDQLDDDDDYDLFEQELMQHYDDHNEI